jgi:hypothetical protein
VSQPSPPLRCTFSALLGLTALAALIVGGPARTEDSRPAAPKTVSLSQHQWQVVGILTWAPQGPLHVLPSVCINPADLATRKLLPAAMEKIETTIPEGVEDRVPVRSSVANYWEAMGYNQLVARAHKFPAEAFAEKARKDVRFVHLWEEPTKYRAAIVHVQGILRRLRRLDPPELSRKNGVENLYEAWLTEDRDNHNLWCVIFTDLPPGLELGEKLDRQVAFDGYFFKLYGFRPEAPGKDGKPEMHAAPLLIAHAPVLVTEARTEPVAGSIMDVWLPVFLGFVGGVIVLTFLVSWWFRRNDERVRLRLASARQSNFMAPEPEGPPTAADPQILSDALRDEPDDGPRTGEGLPPDRSVQEN